MLAENLKELISAALDGELTPDEMRQVRELLWESAEARALYNQLKADRDRLRGLLPVPPPADLCDRVMARLPETGPLATPAPAPARRRLRRLIPVGLAASLLLGITAASFWHFSRQGEGGPDSPPAMVQTPTTDPGPAVNRKWVEVLPREQGMLPPRPPVVEPPREKNADSTEPPESLVIDSIPPPRPVDDPPSKALAFPPVPPVAPFELARVRVPFLAGVAELTREDVGQSLLDDLELHAAARINLFASDPGRGVELFRAAAKAQGVTIFADPSIADRIKRKQATAYVVYLECLNAAEVRALLVALANADARSKERTFDTLHLSTAAATDAKELKEVLGLDPGLWKRPAGNKGDARDPKKPISSGTADEVAKNLAAPAGKAPAKPAMLLALSPDAARIHPAASAELKKYLTQRGPRKDQAVPVMIVIR